MEVASQLKLIIIIDAKIRNVKKVSNYKACIIKKPWFLLD